MLAAACAANDITGAVVPSFPGGWQYHGDACIGASLSRNKSCDYSIGVLEKPGQLILYIGKSATRIDPKKVRWIVTDQMPYARTPTGFQVVYSLCERNGKADETIIAIVKTTDTEWYTNVRFSYRANLSTGRFEKTSTKGVRCLNEGWGV